MKLGLVGLGQFHLAQHAPALLKYCAEVASLDLALCDPSQENLARWQQRLGARPGYSSLEALLAGERLDAAYVTVPPEASCAVVGAFLRTGIPTFTEKPPGLNARQTRQLIAAAGDLPHAVGFNRRFFPLLRKLKELVQEDGGGALLHCRCEFRRVARYDADFTTTLIHGIDAMRFLAGDFDRLSVQGRTIRGDQPFRNLSLHGTTSSGTLVEMTVLPASAQAVERYSVCREGLWATASLTMPGLADAGEVVLWRGNRVAARHTEESLGFSGAPDFARFGFYEQARQFLDGLRGQGPCGTSFQEALQSVEIADFLRSCPDAAEWRA